MRGAGRYLVSALLFAALGILIVLPFLTLLYTSFITATPFSGNETSFTLANYVNIWTPQMHEAVVNTLIVAFGEIGRAHV